MAKTGIAVKRTESAVNELEQMYEQVRRRAYELFRTSGPLPRQPADDWLTAERELVWRPAVEMRQMDSQFDVLAAVAGIEPKDLDVQVTPEDLVIKGNGAHEHGADAGTVHLCEFSRGQLFRAVHFPRRIDPAKVTADYRNGMLRITAPLAETVEQRIDAASE
jgi:HSP20 family molecular chaperone IbpA